MNFDDLAHLETAIAEAGTRIQRQQQMISEFQARGYDVRAPLTLLSCMLVNLRTLENRRRQEMTMDSIVAL